MRIFLFHFVSPGEPQLSLNANPFFTVVVSLLHLQSKTLQLHCSRPGQVEMNRGSQGKLWQGTAMVLNEREILFPRIIACNIIVHTTLAEKSFFRLFPIL